MDALSEAAATGDLGLALVLLQQGADPNAPNSYGKTPIQVMMMDNANMAQLLLDYSANPNIRDADTGKYPAHEAARQGCLDTLITLLNGKAIIHIPDNEGRLPMDLAPSHIVTTLQSRGLLSTSKKLLKQETMEPMIILHRPNFH
ncbi:cyclin-dependent kinase 4 inhibitor B-like [Engystomops pustulosus]|uniref:cyclin-dependent kinase 4 inhibitor B-like n=1 Tax=Engystomops pustulosus TaxID=76066 RepID=UPI003AFA4ED7